jgi:hypothetical protein
MEPEPGQGNLRRETKVQVLMERSSVVGLKQCPFRTKTSLQATDLQDKTCLSLSLAGDPALARGGFLSRPAAPVEGAEPDGRGEVGDRHRLGGFEVGDGCGLL